MGHRRAKLTIAGRQLLVMRIEAGGYTVARAAEAQGVSRTNGAEVAPPLPHRRRRRPGRSQLAT